MGRLDDGDEILVSVTTQENLGKKEKENLVKKIRSKIEPYKDDIMYYTIRTKLKGLNDNYKYKTLDELYISLGMIFRDE